jgi:3-hydroxybutyrate dehydrogenase
MFKMNLSQKTALVTGSTSGIGLAIAHALASQGCNIMLNGFGEAQMIEGLLHEFKAKYNVKMAYSSADMRKPQEIAAMIGETVQKLGALDILVNNAGIQHVAAIENFPQEKWDDILAINLSSAFHTIKASVPLMKAQGFGRIINIASVHGLVGSVEKSAYVAAKHGIVGLTKVVALETAASGLTCNAICPGWVLTPLVQKQIDALAAQKNISNAQATSELLSAKQPNQRFVTPENIGAMVVFLAGEHGQAMTGEMIVMDGGWSAQ